jgi:hypothetical protein
LARSWWQDDLRLLNHLAKNIFKSLALFPCLVAACPRCAVKIGIFVKNKKFRSRKWNAHEKNL